MAFSRNSGVFCRMPVVFTGISGRNQKRRSVIILAGMVLHGRGTQRGPRVQEGAAEVLVRHDEVHPLRDGVQGKLDDETPSKEGNLSCDVASPAVGDGHHGEPGECKQELDDCSVQVNCRMRKQSSQRRQTPLLKQFLRFP